MRGGFLANAAVIAALFLVPALALAENLSTVSDLDLLAKTREAVGAQDGANALQLLTEMQRRGTGIFAGAEKQSCPEVIDLPHGITDWRFKGAARQAYITAAKDRQLAGGACGCLFADYPFAAFTGEMLHKAPTALSDNDRPALETYLAARQRDVEGRYRTFESSCRSE